MHLGVGKISVLVYIQLKDIYKASPNIQSIFSDGNIQPLITDTFFQENKLFLTPKINTALHKTVYIGTLIINDLHPNGKDKIVWTIRI